MATEIFIYTLRAFVNACPFGQAAPPSKYDQAAGYCRRMSGKEGELRDYDKTV